MAKCTACAGVGTVTCLPCEGTGTIKTSERIHASKTSISLLDGGMIAERRTGGKYEGVGVWLSYNYTWTIEWTIETDSLGSQVLVARTTKTTCGTCGSEKGGEPVALKKDSEIVRESDSYVMAEIRNFGTLANRSMYLKSGFVWTIVKDPGGANVLLAEKK